MFSETQQSAAGQCCPGSTSGCKTQMEEGWSWIIPTSGVCVFVCVCSTRSVGIE